MDFEFVVNENLLVYSALLGPKSKNFEAKAVKDILYRKYPIPYRLKGDLRVLFAEDRIESTFEELKEQISCLFHEFKNTREYKNLLHRTIRYMEEIKNKWDEKKGLVVTHLEDILRLEIPNNTASVFIVSPEIGGGMYLGNMKIIWGHDEDWENYNIVYLAHEYLHSFIHGGERTHAIIELITDNELRIRLNGGGKYFIENGHPVGHERLRSLVVNLLPLWRGFLENKDLTIYDLLKELEA